MIQVDIVDYEKATLIDMYITKYVNKNLEDIIRVLIEFMENDSDFGLEDFFPRDYYVRKPQECRNMVYELYELISSTCIRDYIKPKYEYLLYTILSWWEDCSDNKEDLLINPINDDLKRALIEAGKESILNIISDYQEYYNICFRDHDFLPNSLSNLVTFYLRSPKQYAIFFGYDNLDDYVDLMECDLRELYLEERKSQKYPLAKREIDVCIIKEILVVLRRFQKRVTQFETKGEIEITADIHDAVASTLNSKYELHVAREFTMGRAKKKLGETDLYFYKEKDGILEECAILENKYIEKFKNQYFQLIGYLNHNFKFGITLSINKNMSLIEGLEKIEKTLNNIDKETDFSPIEIQRIEFEDSAMLISWHVVPETKKIMKVYHLIFQLKDKERKEVAEIVR